MHTSSSLVSLSVVSSMGSPGYQICSLGAINFLSLFLSFMRVVFCCL